MIVQMWDLGDNGRFGNQIYQFLFLKMLERELGCEIRYPYWQGLNYFNIQASADIECASVDIDFEKTLSREKGPEKEFLQLRKLFTGSLSKGVVDISGYFQYHSSYFEKYRDIFFDTYSIKEIFLTQVHYAIQRLNLQDKFIVGIHIRRGDYVKFNNEHPLFWGASMESVLSTVNDLINSSLKDIAIYLCSDDLEYAERAFQGCNIPYYTNKHLFMVTDDFASLATDFTMLSIADALLISNSTFSFAASMLNRKCRINLRPCPKDDRFISFDPWNSHVILPKYGFCFL